MAATPISCIGRDSTAPGSELIGVSRPLREVWNAIQLVAPTDSTALIQGETGTGKELVAHAIHQRSQRQHAPYVKLNCAAIPAGLLESELFGHERGAFTGAVTQTSGRFQLAHNGTLFLDEIGDMPLELQPKLLRALQEQEFERIGGARTIRVDVRIIAATNQNLEQLVRERRFRADLYYRLQVFPIALPPLRERVEDVPHLVRHFLRKYAARMNRECCHVPDEAMAMLERYHWPGNVRELQNLIERSVIGSFGRDLQMAGLEELRPSKAGPAAGIRTLAEAERDHIREVLHRVGGVIGGRNGAAAKLGVPRTTLLHRMRKLGLDTGKGPAIARPG